MAYGTKYHYQITDYKGVATLVRLKLRDYVGADTALSLGGVTFEFGQDRAATVLRGSSAKIGLWSLTQGQFSEFRSITDRKWMVEILKGGSLYWCGWLTPEIYSEPFKHSLPYRIEISAVDGLGDLANIDFTDNSGQFINVARDSFKNVINQCLNSTGFALNVCYSAALRPAGTAGDMFASCFIALSSFLDSEYKPLKCDEVLERFFPLGITVKQWAGKWYVVRTEDLVAVSHIYEYTSGGVFVSQYDVSFNQTIDNNNTVGSQNLITGQSAIMSSGAAYKEAVVKIDFGKKPSLLNNFDFAIPGDSWLTTLSQYGFQYKETESETYGYLNPMDASGALTGIHQAFPVVATAKDFTLSFKVAPFGWHRVSAAVNTPRQPILLKIKIQVKLVGATTYYLDKDQGWITTEAFIEITDLESTVVPGAAANWHEIKIITDALPISGNMDVWLYRLPWVALPSSQVVLGVGYTAIRAYSDDDAYLSTMELKGVNDPDFNFIPGVKTLMLNDCPDEDNARRLYINYVSNSAGVPTTTWEVDGVAGTYTLAELYLRQAIAMHVRPTKIINMTMRGVVAWPGTMSDGEGNRYEAVSAVLADRNCEWQLEMREILPPEGASPVITSGARTTKSTNSSTRTVNANNDYRTYLNGIGSPKRINDLTHAAAVLDNHRFEVDKAASAESQYIEALELATYVAAKYKLAYNAQLNRIEVATDFSTPGILSALDGNSTNWNTAFSWGNHAGLYRPISYVPSWSEITSKPSWTDKFGWDGTSVTVSTDVHITGKLVVDGTIQFFGSGAGGSGGGGSTTLWGLSDVSDDVANAVNGDLIMYNGTHFARINQSVLAPAVHTHSIAQVNGLQGVLDGKMAIHTHPYLSDSDERIGNWNAAFGWGNHASAGYFPITGGSLTGAIEALGAVSSKVTGTGGTSNNSYANFTAYNPANGYPFANFLIGQNASDVQIGLMIAPLYSGVGVQKPAQLIVSSNKNVLAAGSYQAYMTQFTNVFLIGTYRAGDYNLTATPITFNPGGYEALRLNTDKSAVFTGAVLGITKAMVGLGSVDNTADATKSVATATNSRHTYDEYDGVYHGSSTLNVKHADTATNWSGSGALANYLPLAGGTLTGALNGTTANFSGDIIGNGDLWIKKGGDVGTIYLGNSLNHTIGYNGTYFYINGNATFVGDVTATGFKVNSDSVINDGAIFYHSGELTIAQGASGFGINKSDNSVRYFTINNSGNATFVCDVTALSLNMPSANNWSFIRNNATNGGLKLGTNDGSGTYTDGISISSGGGFIRLHHNTNVYGNITASGTIQFYTASDRRLKTDFEAITNPIEKIKSLTGYFFNYTDQAMKLGGYENRRDIGLIAQDVHSILPEATGKLWNTDFMGYKDNKLIPLLVEGIKQLQNEIDELKRQRA
ncbi:MAG: tail fiber domain-containing protein [Methylobacter sp.]|nr:tail fiber domain-containing protein [Methylobacter sp.]